jgi:hypothetical protein
VPGTDNHIQLTIQSTSGSFSHTWNKNERAQIVYDDALKHFKLPAGQYLLKRKSDGAVLELSQKLGDLGLVNGDILILQAAQPQDG